MELNQGMNYSYFVFLFLFFFFVQIYCEKVIRKYYPEDYYFNTIDSLLL